MRLVALLDPSAALAIQVAWVLTLARAGDEDVLFLLWEDGKGDSNRSVDRVLGQVRDCITRAPGFRHVDSTDPADDRAGSAHDEAAVERSVRIEVCRDETGLAERLRSHETDLFLVLEERLESVDARLHSIGRNLLPSITCKVGILRFGETTPPDELRVAVPGADGPHTRAALLLARDLAARSGRRPTALFVQPPIGVDAEAVGHRALQRTLRRAVGTETGDRFEPVIELEDDLSRGLGKSLDRNRHDLVVMGSWLGELGQRFLGTPAGRLLRRATPPAVLILRDAMPFTNRLRRAVEKALQNRVPQLGREDRVALVERVQSNSAWNFDFVALMVLATTIASTGLSQDSGAVVIGAMLVAPLMTPILGIGLALVQGNARLVRSAARSVTLGVGAAFLVSFVLGLMFQLPAPTNEMLGRGAPDYRDLVVAFFSGLAAAYATSRPNLFSALPGVAIAAALVPPIATVGLATSIGSFGLAGMAALLFLTNFVAIVLSSALSLSAVGLRSVKGTATWMRVLRVGLGILLFAVTAALILLAP